MSTKPPREHTELIGLIEAILIDQATARDVARLDELLASSEAARSIYLDYVDLHACLRRKYAFPDLTVEVADWNTAHDAKDSSPRAAATDKPRKSRASIFWLAVAAMLFLTITLQRSDKVLPADGPQTNSDGVALLSQSLDAQWRRGERTFAKGAVVPAGELVLDGGIVQLDFYNGTVMVLEGPARLSVDSSMATSLQSGRIRTVVPKRVVGFTVATPLGTVVDLGTEFAIEVDEQGETGQVHVITGSVEFSPRRPEFGTPRVLSAGDGLALTSTTIKAIQSKSLAAGFVGAAEVESRGRERRIGRYQGWVDWRKQLWEDPSLLAYYGYSDEDGWSRKLRNFAPDCADDSHGMVVGCEWTQGRWPGHKALAFSNTGHRVSVNLPGQYDSMTLSAWVTVDRLLRGHASLVHSEKRDDRFLGWSLASAQNGGVSYFSEARSRNAEGKLNTNEYNSLTWALRPYDFNRWVHLAVTYNEEAGRVSHYRNGEVIHSTKITSPQPLSIGSAGLGNTPPGESHGANSEVGNLIGHFDELIVFGRALSAKEITRIYRIGEP